MLVLWLVLLNQKTNKKYCCQANCVKWDTVIAHNLFVGYGDERLEFVIQTETLFQLCCTVTNHYYRKTKYQTTAGTT